MAEIIDDGDFGDHNVCLRAIALAANRKRMTELADVLTGEQVFEFLTKHGLGTLNMLDTLGASVDVRVGCGSIYCSVEGCHFETEMVGVEMPGEVGFEFHFPTANEMDNQTFPCKLHGHNSSQAN
ncbi:MAG TPA: hypothetical protein VG964_03210 [Candidatus Saccharimonadales bacterium]|nr:hypothetical protein [Candidatus Saccharimonadales bacterium]